MEALRAGGVVEVYEDGKWAPELTPWEYEIGTRGEHTLLHVWGEERHLTRRVLKVVRREEGKVVVEVERFGQNRPGKLEFLRKESGRPSGRMGRERFRNWFGQLLAEQFPDETTTQLTTAPNLEHSLSGSYPRCIMERGGTTWAVLGASPEESAATVDGALTYGLIWLDRVRQQNPRQVVAGLRLFLPQGGSGTTKLRVHALSTSFRTEIFEFRIESGKAQRVDTRDLGNVVTRIASRREIEQILAQAESAIEPIRNLAPDFIRANVVSGTREVALRYRGLEFAAWKDGDLVAVLRGQPGTRLRPGAAGIQEIVRQLNLTRDPWSEDTTHPFYRASAERWLETIAREDITRIDARLDRERVYSQVPALSGGDRGLMDLLGVTRDGRLAVIELKADDDIQLMMQAADYWVRVKWHLDRGDFQHFGYFADTPLQPIPPLLYLVAPALRFHPATDIVLRYVSPEVEVQKLGINEDWRRGLRVVFRQGR